MAVKSTAFWQKPCLDLLSRTFWIYATQPMLLAQSISAITALLTFHLQYSVAQTPTGGFV